MARVPRLIQKDLRRKGKGRGRKEERREREGRGGKRLHIRRRIGRVAGRRDDDDGDDDDDNEPINDL